MENSIKKIEKHFRNHRNEIIGLDYESGWVQSVVQSSTLGSAYSDTAAVTSCSIGIQSVREVVNCDKLKKFSLSLLSSYTAPTAIGTSIGKRLNKLGLTFLFNVFKRFSFCPRFFYVFNVFYYF